MPTHQWDARDYEKHSAQQQLWARELIQKLKLNGDEAVLDVGCGDGKVTVELAAQLPAGSVVGIDLSPEMIALARERYARQQVPNLNFQQADASRLPFEGQFTVIFSNATLHWVRDHRPVLQGMFRGLKPGGKILLQMGGYGNAAQVVALLDRLIRQPAWSDYFSEFRFPYGFYAPEEYIPWLLAAGFEPLRVELIPKDMPHPGREGLAGWIRTTWLPYTQQVPVEKRTLFVDQLVDAYLAEVPPDPTGNVLVKMARLEVEARRPEA